MKAAGKLRKINGENAETKYPLQPSLKNASFLDSLLQNSADSPLPQALEIPIFPFLRDSFSFVDFSSVFRLTRLLASEFLAFAGVFGLHLFFGVALLLRLLFFECFLC